MSVHIREIPEEFHPDVDRAVAILREFGAQHVYLFGSIIADDRRYPPRDLDIAVSGLPPELFFTAYARLLDELEHEFDLLDLDVETAVTETLKKHGHLEQVA